MENRKAIVKSTVFKKSFDGKYGETFVHEVTFDNGDKGEYLSKSNPQTSFVVGKEVEYTIEEKVNGNYKNNSIKPAKAMNGFVPGKGNPSYEHRRVALRCAVDLVAAGKCDIGKIKEYAGAFMKFLNEEP
jgi:hypothetical protein